MTSLEPPLNPPQRCGKEPFYPCILPSTLYPHECCIPSLLSTGKPCVSFIHTHPPLPRDRRKRWRPELARAPSRTPRDSPRRFLTPHPRRPPRPRPRPPRRSPRGSPARRPSSASRGCAWPIWPRKGPRSAGRTASSTCPASFSTLRTDGPLAVLSLVQVSPKFPCLPSLWPGAGCPFLCRLAGDRFSSDEVGKLTTNEQQSSPASSASTRYGT